MLPVALPHTERHIAYTAVPSPGWTRGQVAEPHTVCPVWARPSWWCPFQRGFPNYGASFEFLRYCQSKRVCHGDGWRFGRPDHRSLWFPRVRGRRLGLRREASERFGGGAAPIPVFLGSTVSLVDASKEL